MGTYVPQSGDLVFFEHDQRPISKLVASLGGPPVKGLKVSHCAIVSDVTLPAAAKVIENTLTLTLPWRDGDPIGGGCESSLASVCTAHASARRLLVVRRGQSSTANVASAAAPWLQDSDYSVPLLLLAALASLHRGLPCKVRNGEFWDAVHIHARAIVARVNEQNQLTQQDHRVGTCAGTLAEIEDAAGQDLDIVEPKCPNWLAAWWAGRHAIARVGAMAELAWIEAHLVETRETVLARVRQLVRSALDEYPNVEITAPTTRDPAEFVRFGSGTVDLVLNQLERVLVLRRVDRYALFRDLLITFHILDELLEAKPDGLPAPGPGNDVYPPLMPLDLILRRYKKQLLGAYAPF